MLLTTSGSAWREPDHGRRPQRRTKAMAAAFMVGALLLAACSDDNNSSGDTTPTDATTAGATPPRPGLPSCSATSAPARACSTSWRRRSGPSLDLAVADIDAAGGVNGQPVKVVTAAEAADGDPTTGLDSLLDQGASVVLGPIGSSSVAKLIPLLDTRKMIACSASATSSNLTTLDSAERFYRTALPDPFTVDYAADAISKLREDNPPEGGRAYKIAMLIREDDYGVSVGATLANVLLGRGFDVKVISYNPRKVVFTDDAAAVNGFAPDMTLLAPYEEAPRQIDALLSAGIESSTIAGLDGLFVPSLGERVSASSPDSVDGVTVLANTGDRAFIDRLVAKSPRSQVVYGAQMYDCAMTVALAAVASGSVVPTGYGPQLRAVTNDGRKCSTFEDCASKLSSGEDIDYQGAIGNVGFDEHGDPSQARYTVARFSGADLKEVNSQDITVGAIRQQEAMVSAVFVANLQQVLRSLGYYEGPIDGVYSSAVVAAVGALQSDLGLPATGIYDAATDAALREKLGDASTGLDASIMALQQMLTDLGLYDGPIDGTYSQATVDAVKALQAALGVPQTGVIDTATLQAAYEQDLAPGNVPTTTTPPTTPRRRPWLPRPRHRRRRRRPRLPRPPPPSPRRRRPRRPPRPSRRRPPSRRRRRRCRSRPRRCNRCSRPTVASPSCCSWSRRLATAPTSPDWGRSPSSPRPTTRSPRTRGRVRRAAQGPDRRLRLPQLPDRRGTACASTSSRTVRTWRTSTATTATSRSRSRGGTVKVDDATVIPPDQGRRTGC